MVSSFFYCGAFCGVTHQAIKPFFLVPEIVYWFQNFLFRS